ncbi:MAG: hypothetical protein PUC82_01920 [bacterium]|nr:hypothetical protein [bacterium]
MDNSLSKQILLSILGIAILIIAFVGISYAVLVTGKNTDSDQEDISISFINNNSNILTVNALSFTDDEGVKLSSENNVFDFVVNADIVNGREFNYEIVLRKIDDHAFLINGNDIRIYLEKLVDGVYVPTSTKMPITFVANGVVDEYGSPADSMTIYTGFLKNVTEDESRFVEKYRLRIWISQNALLDGTFDNFQIALELHSKVL